MHIVVLLCEAVRYRTREPEGRFLCLPVSYNGVLGERGVDFTPLPVLIGEPHCSAADHCHGNKGRPDRQDIALASGL